MPAAKVVILCGGRGTRLHCETKQIPKPLVEVGQRPILWHVMKIFGAQSFDEFVLCLGYKGGLIKDYFLDFFAAHSGDFRLRGSAEVEPLRRQSEPWTVTFAETGEDTNTGGRLHRVRDYLGSETFFVTYSDGVADIDLHELLRFHRAHGKLATVTAIRPRTNYGVMEFGADGVVTRFVEKPIMDQYVNCGFFVFEPGVFDVTDESCSLERDVLPRLVEAGQLCAYRTEGFWACMDTYKDNFMLNEMWERGEAPWRIWS